MLFAASANATVGDLDPSFANGGQLFATLPGSAPSIDDIAVAPGGRIFASGVQDGSPDPMWIAAFTANGLVDSSFNNGLGYETLVTGLSDSTSAFLVVQSDGRPILGGGSNAAVPGFSASRFSTTGAIDPSFGLAGNAVDFHSPFGRLPVKMLAAPNDGFVGIGNNADAIDNPWFERWTAGGAVDPTFALGTGGVEFGAAPGSTYWHNGAVAPDGTIYMVGAHSYMSDRRFIVAKYPATGGLDPGFGNGTGVVIDGNDVISGDSGLTQAAVQPDGKLVVAGVGQFPQYGGFDVLTVERYDPNGARDASFGQNGVVALPLNLTYESWPRGLALMPDGRILLLGASQTSVVSNPTFDLVRLQSNGAPDQSLGPGGIKPLPFIDANSFDPRIFRIEGDGRILIAGKGTDPNNATVAGFRIYRLLADPPPAPPVPLALVPTAKVTSPKHSKLSARRLTRFAGSAGPKGQVRRVEIALQRVDSKLLKRRNRCLWLANSQAKFKSARAAHHRCNPIRWLHTRGTSHWSYRLHHHLKRGKYTLFVRVTLKDGTRGSRFSKQAGTLRTFRLH